jgi:hypothetical protein
MESNGSDFGPKQHRRVWQLPELRSVGKVGEVLQGGGGKLSPSPNDPGDFRKPPGQG